MQSAGACPLTYLHTIGFSSSLLSPSPDSPDELEFSLENKKATKRVEKLSEKIKINE